MAICNRCKQEFDPSTTVLTKRGKPSTNCASCYEKTLVSSRRIKREIKVFNLTTPAGQRKCIRCQRLKPIAEFEGAIHCAECRDYMRAKAAAYRLEHSPEKRAVIAAQKSEKNAALRSDVLAAYGNECACCGEDTEEFLELDHVNNDGNVHRKEIGHCSETFYRWIQKNGYPKNLQLLCKNCNWGKHVNGGICPHQEIDWMAMAGIGTPRKAAA